MKQDKEVRDGEYGGIGNIGSAQDEGEGAPDGEMQCGRAMTRLGIGRVAWATISLVGRATSEGAGISLTRIG